VKGVQALAEEYPITRFKKTVRVVRAGATRTGSDPGDAKTAVSPIVRFEKPAGGSTGLGQGRGRGRFVLAPIVPELRTNDQVSDGK